MNNFNPNLIKKGNNQQQNGPTLLNRNKNGGPIKIKSNNYMNNLSKKPNKPDLNYYNSTATNFMENNINRFKYNTNNIKKDIKIIKCQRTLDIPGPLTIIIEKWGKKDKNSSNMGNNNKLNLNRSNQFANNNIGKPIKYNQRPSSTGGKNKNDYGYANIIRLKRGFKGLSIDEQLIFEILANHTLEEYKQIEDAYRTETKK